MRFAQIVFCVAGIYGLLVIVPLYFMERTIGSQTPPTITHPEYFYGFLGAALAWQLAFLVIAKDPLRYRALIVPCVIEKVICEVALLSLHFQNRIATSTFAIGSIDWIWGALFTAAYFSTAPARAAHPATANG